MNIWRELSLEEKEDFRQWARDNWIIGDDINPTWHPVVREECFHISLKDIYIAGTGV